MNHLLFTPEDFNIPQPHSQQPLLSSGQQFLNEPLHLLLHGPFVYPMGFHILLHFKCKLLHRCPYLIELLVHLSFSFLLVVISSTTSMAFGSYLYLSFSFLENLWITLHLRSSPCPLTLTWLKKKFCCYIHATTLLIERRYSAFLHLLFTGKFLFPIPPDDIKSSPSFPSVCCP
jgi:hypothetical protein